MSTSNCLKESYPYLLISSPKEACKKEEAIGVARSNESLLRKHLTISFKNHIFAKKKQMKALPIEQIKLQYPDEWVLVGNPNLGDKSTVGSIMKRLVSGVVLLHSKDKREVAYKGYEARKGYKSVTLIFTGDVPKKRKFWL